MYEANIRYIHTDKIIKNIKEMCILSNHKLSTDMEKAILKSKSKEESPIGQKIIGYLEKNLEISQKNQIPICQDTGIVVVFIRIGQNINIQGIGIEDAINEGIRQGYREGYLRKSLVSDPIRRENTNDNTPGIIHYEIVPGNELKITVAPKGFGSENMSKVYMLKPSDGIEGIKESVIKTVIDAGPNACPPMVVGVGIGGNFEYCTYLAKKAIIRSIEERSKIEDIRKLEIELLEEINMLGIGPGGLGGRITALGVNIETYPTHIAALPVAVNISCHANRHVSRII